LQRFVPRHESSSTAAFGTNDSPSAYGADKVIDADEKDLPGSEAFLQHWLQTQQIHARRNMMFKTYIMFQTSCLGIDAKKQGWLHPSSPGNPLYVPDSIDAN